MMNHDIYYALILRSDVFNFTQVETEDESDKVASALRNTHGESKGIEAYFASVSRYLPFFPSPYFLLFLKNFFFWLVFRV